MAMHSYHGAKERLVEFMNALEEENVSEKEKISLEERIERFQASVDSTKELIDSRIEVMKG